MNKVELARAVAKKCAGLSRKQAEEVIECLTDIITETIKAGGKVTLAGFGAFSARKRAGHEGVNPRNVSEKIQIPSVTVAKFKAGKNLKEALKAKTQ